MNEGRSAATTIDRRPPASTRGGSLARRSVFFFVFWLMISKMEPAGAIVGTASAVLAAWLSLRLLPPGAARPRPLALLLFAARFAGQSIRAGFDVARRALDPALPISPGFVAYRPLTSSGNGRAAFYALSSLLPGSVPTCEEDGALLVHCLDVRQPVAADLEAEERMFMRAFGLEEARR